MTNRLSVRLTPCFTSGHCIRYALVRISLVIYIISRLKK